MSASPPQPKLHKKKPLTHTNSDKECLRENAGFLRKALYVMDTHNGFKFLSITERSICHALVWFCVATIALYSYAFLRGFIDGVAAPMETAKTAPISTE
jgi:hypothetical protein